jgi:hypothetical protein
VLVALLVSGLAWWRHARQPTVTVTNDSSKVLTVELCPGQDCRGETYRLTPGEHLRIRLKPAVGERSDTLRVTATSGLVGCLPVIRVGPRHQSQDLSQADPRGC